MVIPIYFVYIIVVYWLYFTYYQHKTLANLDLSFSVSLAHVLLISFKNLEGKMLTTTIKVVYAWDMYSLDSFYDLEYYSFRSLTLTNNQRHTLLLAEYALLHKVP